MVGEAGSEARRGAGMSYIRYSNSGHALRSAAEHSLGLAYLPDYYLGEGLASGKLVTVLDDWQAIGGEVVAIYQHKSYLSAKVRLVSQFLAAHFQL